MKNAPTPEGSWEFTSRRGFTGWQHSPLTMAVRLRSRSGSGRDAAVEVGADQDSERTVATLRRNALGGSPGANGASATAKKGTANGSSKQLESPSKQPEFPSRQPEHDLKQRARRRKQPDQKSPPARGGARASRGGGTAEREAPATAAEANGELAAAASGGSLSSRRPRRGAAAAAAAAEIGSPPTAADKPGVPTVTLAAGAGDSAPAKFTRSWGGVGRGALDTARDVIPRASRGKRKSPGNSPGVTGPPAVAAAARKTRRGRGGLPIAATPASAASSPVAATVVAPAPSAWSSILPADTRNKNHGNTGGAARSGRVGGGSGGKDTPSGGQSAATNCTMARAREHRSKRRGASGNGTAANGDATEVQAQGTQHKDGGGGRAGAMSKIPGGGGAAKESGGGPKAGRGGPTKNGKTKSPTGVGKAELRFLKPGEAHAAPVTPTPRFYLPVGRGEGSAEEDAAAVVATGAAVAAAAAEGESGFKPVSTEGGAGVVWDPRRFSLHPEETVVSFEGGRCYCSGDGGTGGAKMEEMEDEPSTPTSAPTRVPVGPPLSDMAQGAAIATSLLHAASFAGGEDSGQKVHTRSGLVFSFF